MSYEGPSLSEWLAEYRSRREPTEVVLYRATLPRAARSHPSRQEVAALVIARYDEPDNPKPTGGFYLFSLDAAGRSVADTWHESVDDAFEQAEREFRLAPSEWAAIDDRS